MPTSSDLYNDLVELVAKIQAVIDRGDELHDYSYTKSPEYIAMKADQARLQKLYRDTWNVEHNAVITEKTGFKIGDRVHYFAMQWMGIGGVMYTGKIVMYRGVLKVRSDDLIEGKRYFQVNNGWTLDKEQ